ncbi:MAG TPA: DUF4386 domain-containing protein [Candidatus Limnocylindrales bacterium]|jgi:hypothetical protein|nr:DUF4386 domain-containing protein [Candidatus Limnocylindrales bacterium]
MDSIRKSALVAGTLYLLTFVGSIVAALLLGPAQNDPSLTLDTIPNSQVRLAAVFELLNALTCFGTALAVFSIVKREHEGLALGFVATRLFEAATLGVGIIALLTVATLRENGVSFAAVGPALVAIRFWSVVIGPGMAAFNALMFGTLLYRSRLVPRAIPALGILGAPVYISFTVGTMLGITGAGTAWQAIGVAPFFIWELAVGLWMTFKGFDRNAPIVAAFDAKAEATSRGAVIAAKAGVA